MILRKSLFSRSLLPVPAVGTSSASRGTARAIRQPTGRPPAVAVMTYKHASRRRQCALHAASAQRAPFAGLRAEPGCQSRTSSAPRIPMSSDFKRSTVSGHAGGGVAQPAYLSESLGDVYCYAPNLDHQRIATRSAWHNQYARPYSARCRFLECANTLLRARAQAAACGFSPPRSMRAASADIPDHAPSHNARRPHGAGARHRSTGSPPAEAPVVLVGDFNGTVLPKRPWRRSRR